MDSRSGNVIYDKSITKYFYRTDDYHLASAGKGQYIFYYAIVNGAILELQYDTVYECENGDIILYHSGIKYSGDIPHVMHICNKTGLQLSIADAGNKYAAVKVETLNIQDGQYLM